MPGPAEMAGPVSLTALSLAAALTHDAPSGSSDLLCSGAAPPSCLTGQTAGIPAPTSLTAKAQPAGEVGKEALLTPLRAIFRTAFSTQKTGQVTGGC